MDGNGVLDRDIKSKINTIADLTKSPRPYNLFSGYIEVFEGIVEDIRNEHTMSAIETLHDLIEEFKGVRDAFK